MVLTEVCVGLSYLFFRVHFKRTFTVLLSLFLISNIYKVFASNSSLGLLIRESALIFKSRLYFRFLYFFNKVASVLSTLAESAQLIATFFKETLRIFFIHFRFPKQADFA